MLLPKLRVWCTYVHTHTHTHTCGCRLGRLLDKGLESQDWDAGVHVVLRRTLMRGTCMLNLGAGRKSRLRGVCLCVLSMTTRHIKRKDWLLQPREQLCTMVQSRLCQEKERDRQTGQETSRVEVGSPFKKGLSKGR